MDIDGRVGQHSTGLGLSLVKGVVEAQVLPVTRTRNE